MQVITDNNVCFAGICETWLRDTNCPTTAVIKSYGFSVIHNIRPGNRRGGGTALISKTGIPVSGFRVSTQFSSFEYTCATTKTPTGTKVTFLIVYRPGPMNSSFNKEIDNLLSTISQKCDILILAGDLNIHFELTSNKVVKQSLDILRSYGLQRKVFDSTHIAGGSLDQIFVYSQFDQMTTAVTVDQNACIIGSDHYPVFCDMSLSYEHKYFKDISFRKLKSIDSSCFRSELSTLIGNLNYETFPEAVMSLHNGCTSLLDDHAPLISKRVSVIDSAPWFDNEYRNLRKLRRKCERLARKPGAGTVEWQAYKDLCDECTNLAQQKKKQHFNRMICNSDGNPKTLYKIVNKALDRKQTKPIPDYTDNLSELADDFNSFFISKIENIRNSMDKVDSPVLPELEHSSLLHEFRPTSTDEALEIIKEFGLKCSPSDLLPLQLLKENIDILLPCIVRLINVSLASGNIDGVKLADIIPLLKSDSLDHNVLKNFRPVSNLLFIGKLTERVVLKRLNEHMTVNSLHIEEQSAYKKQHSTETLSIRICNDLLVAADERTATVVMMLDLSAAFDTVDHDLLLRILKKEIGLRGKVLDWFASFLKGRSQRIRLGSTLSEVISIRFGVPQGSVLGPVLFNIYIRSIYQHIRSLNFVIHGYADDHQILKSFHPRAQGLVLTAELSRCFKMTKSWMNQYYLQMNDTKTQIIIFGSSRILKEITIGGVNFDCGATVRFINTVKNLGVHMDSALSFDKQIVELKKNCFRTLRNICKIRFLLNTDQLKQIVNSLVVSCLDYCNGLYFGISEKLYHQLQLIQNACAKAVTGKYKHDHLEDDLKTLHWLTIKRRVLFKIALLAYKSVNGYAPQYLQSLFRYSHHGHTLKLIVPSYNTAYGKRSFGSIGPRLFNRLPSSVTTSPSIATFKASLKTYLFNISSYELEKLCE